MEHNRYRIDFEKRFAAAFGSNPGAYRYAPGVLATEAAARIGNTILGDKKYIAEGFQHNDPRGTSLINTPLFDVIKVSKPLAYEFPNDPLVDFYESKRFVETEIQGGDDVVEMISVAAIEIRLRGVFWAGDGLFPDAQIRAFKALWKQHAILDVSSRLFNLHEIKSIYIKNVRWPGIEGFEDSQPFEIEARSAKPVELNILDL